MSLDGLNHLLVLVFYDVLHIKYIKVELKLFISAFQIHLVFFTLLFWSSEFFFTSTYPSSLSLFLRKKETVQNSPKASNRSKIFLEYPIFDCGRLPERFFSDKEVRLVLAVGEDCLTLQGKSVR